MVLVQMNMQGIPPSLQSLLFVSLLPLSIPPPPNICSRILLVRMIQKLTKSWEILWKKQHLFRLLFFTFSFVEFLSANHSDDLVSGFSSESTGAQHKFSRSRLFSGAVRWCSGMGWVHNSLLIGATATVWAPWFHLSCFSCGRSRSFTVINSITCRKIQIWPPHFGNSKTPISKISREWCICQTTFPSDNLLKLCTSFWLFILNQQNWVSLKVVSAKKITRNDGLIDCVRWCRRWQHSWKMARKHGGWIAMCFPSYVLNHHIWISWHPWSNKMAQFYSTSNFQSLLPSSPVLPWEVKAITKRHGNTFLVLLTPMYLKSSRFLLSIHSDIWVNSMV